ncbi:MAG: iron-sulfur cluster assembly scaffold protein [Candidatus Puniceispirillaceae bacterium]
MIDELYQTQILSLARQARASAELAHPTHQLEMKNPLCGDHVRLSLQIDDGVIVAISCQVKGCALCEAGAGLCISMIKDQPTSEIYNLCETVKNFLNSAPYPKNCEDVLMPFTPVRSVKNRHKCVTLTFDALTRLNH